MIEGAFLKGAPLDYTSTLVIQPGDSGGPDFIAGTHTIVSVNSGEQRASSVQFLARVDLVRFSAGGHSAKSLRYAERRAEKIGARFEIVPAADVPLLLAVKETEDEREETNGRE